MYHGDHVWNEDYYYAYSCAMPHVSTTIVGVVGVDTVA